MKTTKGKKEKTRNLWYCRQKKEEKVKNTKQNQVFPPNFVDSTTNSLICSSFSSFWAAQALRGSVEAMWVPGGSWGYAPETWAVSQTAGEEEKEEQEETIQEFVVLSTKEGGNSQKHHAKSSFSSYFC